MPQLAFLCLRKRIFYALRDDEAQIQLVVLRLDPCLQTSIESTTEFFGKILSALGCDCEFLPIVVIHVVSESLLQDASSDFVQLLHASV